MWRLISSGVACAFALLALPATDALALPGDLDPEFGTNGVVSGLQVVDPNPYQNLLNTSAATFQADGKLVLAGFSQRDTVGSAAFLLRLNADGHIDTSFGDAGFVYTNFGVGTFENVGFTDVTVTADQRIVASGYRCPSAPAPHCEVVAARYLASGAPDPTFGTSGTTILPLPAGGYTDVNSAAHVVDSAGNVYVGGSCVVQLPDGAGGLYGLVQLFVARLAPSGFLDSGFGAAGQTCVYPDVSPPGAPLEFTEFLDIALDAQGRVIAFGEISGSQILVLARLSSNGVLDTAPGGPVPLLFSPGSHTSVSRSIIIREDGDMVTAGYATNGSGFFAVLNKFTSAFAPVESFGTNSSIEGQTDFAIGSTATRLTSARVACSGEIFATGLTSIAQSSVAPYIAAFEPNGSVSSAFGANGYNLLSDLATSSTTTKALALDGNNRAAILGTQTDVYGNTTSFVAVYETAPQCQQPQPDREIAHTGTNSSSSVFVFTLFAMILGAIAVTVRRARKTNRRQPL